MEYDCHIFSKYLVFQIKKPSTSVKIPSISIEISMDLYRNTRYFDSEF